MKDAFIYDADGTLCDLSHRLHHFRRDHAAFEAEIADDAPIWPVIKLARATDAAGYANLITTGRGERTRDASTTWFKEYNVPFERMYMRADGDTRPDHVVKRQILAGIRDDGYNIVAVIDDRQSVVDMWREEGLTCLQAAPSSWDMPEGLCPTLTMMVGPSGSGKSSWLATNRAANDFGIHGQHIIASDRVRLDLYGTIQCMDKNEHVFEALRTVIRARLKSGLPVTLDATNLRNKDRVETAGLAGGICPVRYIVLDRPLRDKLRDGGWRLDVKFADGSNLIERHDQVFKSNLKAILSGDGLPNVDVFDERHPIQQAMAA